VIFTKFIVIFFMFSFAICVIFCIFCDLFFKFWCNYCALVFFSPFYNLCDFSYIYIKFGCFLI
jgi:hypothetical protein